MYIDNLEVSEWSSCQAPYNVEVSNITDNSVSLSFAAVDATASFEYVLVEGVDTDVATGTAVAVTDGLTVALSELSPATIYNVAVRTVCGEGEYSPWSAPATFKTLAVPETIPYSTDFVPFGYFVFLVGSYLMGTAAAMLLRLIVLIIL